MKHGRAGSAGQEVREEMGRRRHERGNMGTSVGEEERVVAARARALLVLRCGASRGRGSKRRRDGARASGGDGARVSAGGGVGSS